MQKIHAVPLYLVLTNVIE